MSIFHGRADLLVRFRAGDRAALEEVYWAYVGRVEGIIRHGFARVEGAALADVGDVVQETFARAFSDDARLRFDGLRDYGPYLWSIARHALAECWRRAGRHQLVPDAEALSDLAQDTASEVDDGAGLDPALQRAVQDYLATLSPEMAAVHRELYVAGRSQRDAADALGISRQSLRTLERHLLKGLAAALRRRKLRP